ncbi:MAG: ribbon-helix-helix domain-containing protein [Candidatus Nezhaarchaeales archaeon]
MAENNAKVEKLDVEESIKIGRKWGQIWGTLKRAEPQLMQALEELEKQTGLSKYDIVREALSHYVRVKYFQHTGLTVSELYQAFLILREFMGFCMEMYNNVGKIYFGELNQSFGALVEEAMKRRLQMIEEHQKKLAEIEKKKEEEVKKKTIEEKFRERIEPMLDVIGDFFEGMMYQMFPQLQKNKPQVKVPVKVEGV